MSIDNVPAVATHITPLPVLDPAAGGVLEAMPAPHSFAEPRPAAAADLVRVAVIGYGYWGPNVVRNLHALEHCEVAAICDRNPAVLRRASRAYPGMPTTSDFAEV